jgi:DNA polymerase III delta prime subunit
MALPEDRSERKRVYAQIAPLIMQFSMLHAGRMFHVEELRQYVRSRVPEIAPDSPGRILRALRQERQLDYVIVNRRDSLYQYNNEETPQMAAMTNTDEPLILRHRPQTFTAMYGHAETLGALERRVTGPGRPHAYLFTGPSGVGKTTLARIVGGMLDATIEEIDAASNSGVDAMRELVEAAHYRVPGAHTRLIIVDECQRLSRAAWDAALKVLEEPPAHLYWALCTTELSKVPDTIVSRCHHVRLNPLDDRDIMTLLLDVLEAEGWADTINDDVLELVMQEAEGLPRLALTHLQNVYDAPTRAEAERIIGLQGPASPLRQVLQFIVSGRRGWDHIRPLLAQLSADDFNEGSLTGASRYLIGAINRETKEERAKELWELLACMVYPAHTYDPRSIFYAAIGRMLWSGP